MIEPVFSVARWRRPNSREQKNVPFSVMSTTVRHAFGDKVELIPLKSDYLMRQTIGLSFLRVRERDPNLLALAAVCRMLKHRTPAG